MSPASRTRANGRRFDPRGPEKESLMNRRFVVAVLSVASLLSTRQVLAQSAPETGAGQVAAADSEAARKAELASAILAARESATGRAFSPQLRARLGSKLRSVDLARLETFHAAGGLGDIDALARDGGPYSVGRSEE